MRRGSTELSDQNVRTWVPFIRRKVLVGRRITRLTELLWAIHLFLHFLTKPGETFIIDRPREYDTALCYCHLSYLWRSAKAISAVFCKNKTAVESLLFHCDYFIIMTPMMRQRKPFRIPWIIQFSFAVTYSYSCLPFIYPHYTWFSH